ncbi:MAG TPA: phosphotransferase family protein [Acidimicrobiales bacterium]
MASRTHGEQPAGLDAERVTAWLSSHIPDIEPPLTFTLIAGGRSNLTYRVEDSAGRRWALRRPPLGHVLATAHDVAREHRIMSALAPTEVPVPEPVALCEDVDVNGAPFYVMSFVDGVVLRDIPTAEAFDAALRPEASRSLVDALAAIHAVDVDAVGLGQLARREGYIERQLKRWRTQYEATRSIEAPAIERAHELLAAKVPKQGPAGIVHGDFRLDNCIFGPDGHVAAVLDWELCTLGDVLADLGQLLVYWTEPGEDGALESPPTTVPGFFTRDELVARYAERTGRDLSQLDFYVAFAAWKVACILDGVHKRYAAGAMGAPPEHGLDSFRKRVLKLAERAETIASTL